MTPTFQGEVQFRRYSDTSTQGQQVVFAVQDREALEAFIGKEGKRFMAVLVEIGDDEQPIPSNPAVLKQREHVGDLCYRAVMWCKSGEFQDFIRPIYDRVMGGDGSGWGDVQPSDFSGGELEYAAHAIKVICRVDSRKELDTEPARSIFMKEIVGPWQKYKLARGARA